MNVSNTLNNQSNEVEPYPTPTDPMVSSPPSHNIEEKIIGLCEKEKKARTKLSLSYK
ncbi:10327_t:CDS:2 [Entrophospora sp. SA101]|nr:10327_t:CDS:2 [Entrophospora sp. SA101]